jgi:imidazolonepropionase-like amidohydrolase
MKPTIAGLITFLCLSQLSAFAQGGRGFAIRDVRLFDGVQTSEHRTVLVENGKIVRVAGNSMRLEAATATINGTGMTLLPGLIDSHVHIGTPVRDALRNALSFGVTTELDMFTDADRLKEMKAIAAEDPPDVADIRSAGIGATVPGGHPTEMGGPQIPTISEPGEAQAFVDARIAEGSDYIKIIHDGRGGMPDTSVELLKALIDAAHKRGKLAVVHALSEKAAREAVTAGADGLVHVIGGKEASSDFGHFVARRHVFVVPTLVTIYWACGKSTGLEVAEDPKIEPYLSSLQKKALATPGSESGCSVASDEALQELIGESATILAGTDAPIPGTAYGASLHEELALYVHLGMASEQALAAATSVPARVFGLKDRGVIKPGMRADMLLVQGDPTTDIQATRNIVAIWKRGVRFERKRATE